MRIIIELPTWLGDSVMATPAIENIVNFYSDPKITIIGSNASIELLNNHPKVIKTIVIDKRYLSLFKMARNLGEFDVFFSFRNSIRSTLLKFFINSIDKFQFNKKKYHNAHLVEKYNNFINSCLGVSSSPNGLKLRLNSNDCKTIDFFRTIEGEKYIESTKPILGINPGAQYGSAKRWNSKKFAIVASELSSKFDILIFGGPKEKAIAKEIEYCLIDNNVTNYHNLGGRTSVKELMGYMSQLSLLITGDSGPMHIAAGFQVPTIAIFGPTDDKETSQWMNNKSVIVKKNLSCQPCMKRTCPLIHHHCMELIEVKDILNAADVL
jgi:heptosyltransferase II